MHYTFQRSACNTYPLFNELSAEKIVIVATFPFHPMLFCKECANFIARTSAASAYQMAASPTTGVIKMAHSGRNHAEAASTLRKMDKQPIN
ncbi:hypothetical protein [Serratia inhibens]|uniref:hypothetical protein n=1 Tax=Serratia inhibens TaxID=2338073 RepID=UPI0011DF3F21|nr:hypothetical protein [Serratia inhibens]